jgi:tRNA (adenine22-N1)-methyltransferase
MMIARIVPKGTSFADIGADHGYLIKYLKENDLISFAYASDNKKGPYSRLKENVQGLDIKTSCVDGITNLPKEVNCVCIAGMGGDTIISILEENKKYLNQIEYFVISAHSLNNEVRKYLFDNGYSLIDQDACFDPEPLFYEVNLFKKGKMEYDEIDVEFGRFLLKHKNLAFIQNIKNHIEKINGLLQNKSLPLDKITDLTKELDKYSNLLKNF